MIIQIAAGGAALVGLSLISGYKPVLGNSGLMLVKRVAGDGQYMRPDAADAFNALVEAAAAQGVTLLAGSAFRSVAEQAVLYALYLQRWKAAPTVAAPGTSNHGNGTAVDVASAPGVSLSYGSAGYRWMTNNASRFGFSWDEGSKVDEPWHWRFVG